jgi:carboxylesterase
VAEANLTTWHDWYAELERNLAELSAQCEQVFVMGLSMGGTLAIRLAEEHGAEITGLVLVNPSLLTKRPDRFLLPVLRLFVPSWTGIASDIKKPGEVELAYDRIPMKAAYSLSKLWITTRADLGKVTQPILIYRSADDHVVEPDSSALLKAKVASSDVREVVLEDSYHVATLDNDAPTIFEGSVEFVRRLARASA